MTPPSPQSTTPPPDYVAAFGLDSDPFQERHEARFFYADPALMQRLDLLQHLTRFSEQLLYVRAPEGAGKTMLSHQLRLRAADHWRLCQLDGASLGSPAELYVQLSRCYPDAAAENTEHFGSDLVHYCLGLQQSGQLAVLVIDAAERLSAPVLEALLNLAQSPTETLKALRILLFAGPELQPTLQSLALESPGDALVHTLDLPPFDEQQSAAYLMYRLAIAGYSGDSPFSATEVRAMHKSAAGRPGALNALARDTLLEQVQRRSLSRRAPADRPHRRRWPWVAGLSLAALAVLAVGWWQLASREPGLPLVRDHGVTLPPANPLAGPGDIPGQPAQAEAEPEAPDTPIASETTAAPVVDSAPEQAPPELPTVTGKAPAAPSGAATQPDSEAATPPETQPGEVPGAAPSPEPPADTPSPAPATPGEAPPAKTDTETSAQIPAQPADWLDRQPDGHYTLQLLGAREPATVESFLNRHGEHVELHPVRTWREEAAWHIIITGSYPDRAAAAAAIEALPAALRQLQPWPRRFEQIRDELPPD